MLAVFPALSHGGRAAISQRWTAALLKILGVRLQLEGASVPEGPLVVANHVSWLDVLVVNSVCPATFVSKHEVGAWPVVGVLLARTGTILLRRGSYRDAKRVVGEVALALRAGRRVAVFPEGTTTDGSSVLPFRPAIFQAAVDQQHRVLPLALSYHGRCGALSSAPVYTGNTSLWQSLRRIALARPRIIARVRVLPEQAPRDVSRRQLAARTRELILEQLGGQQQPAAVPEVTAQAVARGLGVPAWFGAVEDLLQVAEPGAGLAHVGLEARHDTHVE